MPAVEEDVRVRSFRDLKLCLNGLVVADSLFKNPEVVTHAAGFQRTEEARGNVAVVHLVHHRIRMPVGGHQPTMKIVNAFTEANGVESVDDFLVLPGLLSPAGTEKVTEESKSPATNHFLPYLGTHRFRVPQSSSVSQKSSLCSGWSTATMSPSPFQTGGWK